MIYLGHIKYMNHVIAEELQETAVCMQGCSGSEFWEKSHFVQVFWFMLLHEFRHSCILFV